jgi:tRNA dimethylallyltransferase
LAFSSKKTVVIVCGPTAVGKTSVAISLARYFQSEIISADSRQCFKELHIGVARPFGEELKEVPHHFIAAYSVHENINAAFFEQYALQKTRELFEKHDVVIMVGGTGLYIKAFCEGLDKMPLVDEAVRQKISSDYAEKGIEWLHDKVREKDPRFFAVGEIQNPQRMMRALEVVESTGKSILDFRKNKKGQRDFNIIRIGLELPKEDLHRNINSRVDKMIGQGLIDEVRSLTAFKDLNALQTVGYSEMFDHISGEKSLKDAIEEMKKNTRQYAKRQMTWFRKDKEIKWFSPVQVPEMITWIEKNI